MVDEFESQPVPNFLQIHDTRGAPRALQKPWSGWNRHGLGRHDCIRCTDVPGEFGESKDSWNLFVYAVSLM